MERSLPAWDNGHLFLFWTFRATYLFAQNPVLFYSLRLPWGRTYGDRSVVLVFIHPTYLELVPNTPNPNATLLFEI